MRISELKQFDTVLLTDGRVGAITDMWPDGGLLIDIGYSPLSWDSVSYSAKDVIKVLSNEEYRAIKNKYLEKHPEEVDAYLDLFDDSDKGNALISLWGMKKKYIGKTESLGLINGKVYDVISIEKSWYRIIDESGEDYLYNPDFFVEPDEEGYLDEKHSTWVEAHLK